ncbi:immunoglobulin I-set domain-containing protein [Opitutaceae bacterium TAV1]|nr:immunoglobulin I-set domain-containing protein [Opitutaceae bacterium TAV1]
MTTRLTFSLFKDCRLLLFVLLSASGWLASSTIVAADPYIPEERTVDVLVLYTANIVDYHVTADGVKAEINAMIAQTNEAYLNSGVTARIRLAHCEQTPYVEKTSAQGGYSRDLSVITGEGGYTDPGYNKANMAALRDRTGADLVVLFRRGAADGTAGIAWVMNNSKSGNPGYGFAVVGDNSLNSFIFAHELGHNMGLRHDHTAAEESDGAIFPYAYGHLFPDPVTGPYGTIMSYVGSRNYRIPHFSNPDVVYTIYSGPYTGGTYATGVATGTKAADAARALEQTVPVVATYRAAVPLIYSVNNDDPVPPSGEAQPISIAGANFWGNCRLIFTAPDGSTRESGANDILFAAYDLLICQFNNGNLTGTWTVTVTDPVGKSSAAFPFTVAETAEVPTVTITTPPGDVSISAGTTSYIFSGGATAPGSLVAAVEAKVGQGSWAAVSSASGTAIEWSFNLTDLESGANVVSVRARNTQGIYSAVVSRTITRQGGGGSHYTLTLNASPEGGGTVSGSGTFAADSSCTVTATANEYHAFVNWMENDVPVSSQATWTFTLNRDRSLVASFAATQPPRKPVNPMPTDGASSQSSDFIMLSWTNGGGATKYRLYTGTSPENLLYEGETASPYRMLSRRDPGMTCYWRVDAVNAAGTTIGDVWRFTTGGAPDVTMPTLTITSPANGDTFTVTTITVSGTATDAGRGDSGITSVMVNDQPAANGTATGDDTANWSHTLTLSSGTNLITAVAVDGAGNASSPRMILVTCNPSAPPPVPQKPVLTAAPASQTANVGATVVFTAAASGAPAPAYQWHKDGKALPGKTAATLTLTNVQASDAGTYKVVASNSAGTAEASATLTVKTPLPPPPATEPSITAHPQSRTVWQGESATFTVAVSVGQGVLSYQWHFNGKAVKGAIGSSYTLPKAAAKNAGDYTVTVRNTLSGESVTSNPARLSVNMPQKPKVTTRPASKIETGLGKEVILVVAATGNPPPTYQWMKDGQPISGATSATLRLANVTAADLGKYTCVITSGPNKVTSSATTLSAILPPAIDTPALSSGDITYALAAKGAKLSVKIAKNKAKPTYLWLLNGNPAPGANNKATYTAKADGVYSVRVTNAAGSVEKTVANVKLIAPPKIASIIASTTNIVAGDSVRFTATLQTGTGTPPLTWTWLLNGKPILGAPNAATYTATNITTAGKYSVQVTNGAGKVLGKAKSKAIAIKVIIPPAVTITAPANGVLELDEGKTGKLAVKATGTAKLVYQWYKLAANAAGNANGTPVANATKATLTLARVTAVDAGRYYVVVTNAAGASRAARSTNIEVRVKTAVVATMASIKATSLSLERMDASPSVPMAPAALAVGTRIELIPAFAAAPEDVSDVADTGSVFEILSSTELPDGVYVWERLGVTMARLIFAITRYDAEGVRVVTGEIELDFDTAGGGTYTLIANKEDAEAFVAGPGEAPKGENLVEYGRFVLLVPSD